MKRASLRWMTACLGALPISLLAQSMDMQDMPGMAMPMPQGNATPSNANQHTPSQHDDVQHAGHDMATMQDPSARPANDHVAPPPPQNAPHDMSPSQMKDMMQMDDNESIGMLLVDRLERSRSTSGDYATNWEAEGWYGNPIDRLWLKTEGERGSEGTQDARVDALWSHAWTRFWDGQLGVRQDFGQGPNRTWLAMGVEGLAPYWFETQATFYVGEQGRTALRVETSYDMRFTQKLILTPKLELNLYGKDDPQRGIASGLSEAEAGLRLRYEISRRFAPYIGVDWTRRFGDIQSEAGVPPVHANETTWVAGVRLWF